VLRAKIIPRRANGESFRDIGLALDCDFKTAWKCIQTYIPHFADLISRDLTGFS